MNSQEDPLTASMVAFCTLGAMSDRVHVSRRISKKFQHLVRSNSIF